MRCKESGVSHHAECKGQKEECVECIVDGMPVIMRTTVAAE